MAAPAYVGRRFDARQDAVVTVNDAGATPPDGVQPDPFHENDELPTEVDQE